MRVGAMKKMASQDRDRLLEGLKTNWNFLHHQYQGLRYFSEIGQTISLTTILFSYYIILYIIFLYYFHQCGYGYTTET